MHYDLGLFKYTFCWVIHIQRLPVFPLLLWLLVFSGTVVATVAWLIQMKNFHSNIIIYTLKKFACLLIL